MKIFVLDDSPLRLDIFRRRFGGEHTVVTAQTAANAIEILSEQSFDMIFLDHDLGGKPPEYYGQDCDPNHPNTGSEVVRWMAKNPAPRHIIVHSRNNVVAEVMVRDLMFIPGTSVAYSPFDRLTASWGLGSAW